MSFKSIHIGNAICYMWAKFSIKAQKTPHIRSCKNQVLQKNLQYCYSVILKVELHCSSIVKRKTNILLVLTLSIPLSFSLTGHTLISTFFFFFFFFSSLIQSLPLSRSSLPFHIFPLYFPLNQGFDVVADGFDVGLMWWRVFVVVAIG